MDCDANAKAKSDNGDCRITSRNSLSDNVSNAEYENLLSVVGLDCAYDMSWQTKFSGHRFDSHSGHAFLFRLKSKKIVSFVVYYKFCR